MTDYRSIELEDEVISFVTHEVSYIAFTREGRRLDILKSSSFQPEIEDPEDYFTYMWVKALQGYFLLRQRYVESRPQEWFVIRELEPESNYLFYEEFLDELPRYLEGLPAA